MSRHYLILLIVVLFCVPTIGSASGYVKLTQFTTEEGLKQNTIVNLHQDRDGYLWISTTEGLSRFDGYRMTSLQSSDDILELYGSELVWQDSQGVIWIGSYPENNYRLDKEQSKLTAFKFEGPAGYKLDYPVMTKIVENSNNDLWIATFREIFFFDRSSGSLEYVISLPEIFDDPKEEHIFRDLLLVDGYLIIATSKGVYSFDTKTKRVSLINHSPQPIKNEDQNNIKSLTLNQDNQILIGSVQGLYVVSASELKLSSVEQQSRLLVPELNIWEIIEKHDYYWLATNDGLYRLSRESELEHIFRFSDTPFSTSDDDIVTMIEDGEGSLWFGTNADGVFKWRPNESIARHWWSKGTSGYQLSEDMVNDISIDEDTIWVSTNNGLTKVNKMTGKTSKYIVNPDDKAVYSGSTIYSVTKNKGKLWINTAEGIKVYDQKTMQQEQFIFPKTDEKVFEQSATQLHFFSSDRLAIINERGIYDYDLSNNSITFLESTASNDNFKDMFYGFYDSPALEKGKHYLAGVDKLYIYSENTQEVEVFHQIKEVKESELYTGDVFREGNELWVTYPGHGIYILNATSGKQIKFFDEKDIGANSVMDIFPDKLGNIWFTTNDGLLRMNRLNFQVTKFDRHDGLASPEFNGATKEILPNGRVLLGSVKGMYLFDPNKIYEREVQAIKPLITDVSLMSSSIEKSYGSYNDKTINMYHDDFGLNLHFSAFLFDKPKQVRYFYWIEGDSKLDKIPLGESELFVSRFPAGKNKIFISAVDYRNGLESEPASLIVVTHPAWWASREAISTYVILVLLSILFGYRRYHNKLRAKEKVYNRIKLSEERLSLALEGSKSGLWDWHASNNSVYEPRLIDSIDREQDQTVSFKERFAAIHYKDQNRIMTKWQAFLKGEAEVYEVTYRMKDRMSQWQWYRDIAMISQLDSNNNPTRVTGTYTNITEMQQAGEKTRLYSSAFENTLEVIVILDKDKKVIACNHALHNVSGWSSEDITGKSIDDLLLSVKQKNITNRIFEDIGNKRQWKGEALLKNRRSRLVEILVNATMFVENDTEQYFVFSMSDISKQKEAESELKKLVNYDPLTNMPNRTLLLDRITHAIPHCNRYQKQLAVFFVDLDRFKQVNDTLGHDAGDLLLIKSANILEECCRDDDTVARIGGDEFVVMLEDIDSVSAINRILQNILEKMKEPVQLGQNRVTISASIGISIYPQDASDAVTMLKHADIAMYHAKNKGRNNFQYFQDYMNRAAKYRLTLENKIRAAVAKDEFSLVFQPLFGIASGKIRGVEALARWRTEAGENIPPSSFIPLAEELGLIIPMTEKLMRDALDQLTQWNSAGREVVLAFNVSAAHIYDKGFIEFIDTLVNEYPKTIQFLEIELTESILMEDIEKARRVFEKLDDYGIELALDDFGTGYSSLKYLSRLPISKLKIDMSFVQQIGSSFENDTVIETVISLAKSLNLKTVAEGIENTKQFEFLRNANVDFAQGYLFSKPVIGAELEDMLDKNIYDLYPSSSSQSSIN